MSDKTSIERIYVSHGATCVPGSRPTVGANDVDWFIVEPRNDPVRLALEVQRLRLAGRSVYPIEVRPWRNRRWANRARARMAQGRERRIIPFPPFLDRKGKW